MNPLIFNTKRKFKTVTKTENFITQTNVREGYLEKCIVNGVTYQDGTPTSQNPIDIQKVESQTKITCYGRNLFEYSTHYDFFASNKNEYALTTHREYIQVDNINGVSSEWGYISVNIDGLLKILQPNTYYTISFDERLSNLSTVIIMRGDGTEALSTLGTIVNGKTTIKTNPTISLNNQVLYFNIKDIYNTTNSAILGKIQIEVGSIATTYEPYKSNSITIPSDLYGGDFFNIFAGKKIKKCSVVYLNGTEEWLRDGASQYWYCPTLGIIFSGIENLKGFCNYGVVGNKDTAPNILITASGIGYMEINNDMLGIGSGINPTSTILTYYNSGIPLTFVYELHTPIIEIYNSQSLLSYNGTNNIYSDSMLQPIINADLKVWRNER